MAAAPARTWQKLASRLGTDGNPLRRRSDVTQALLPLIGFVVFLAISPLIFMVASAWVHADNATVIRQEQSWHSVQAVLLRAAPGPEFPDRGSNSWTVWEPARWTDGGHTRVADVPVQSRTMAGTTQTVWLDKAGHVEKPPMTRGELSGLVGSLTVLLLGGAAIVLCGIGGLVVLVLNRHRMAGWERQWRSVGPRWSRQQR